VNRECYQHTPLSLGLTEEKAVRLNEAVKEETVIVAKETRFREVSEDAISFCDINEGGTGRVGLADWRSRGLLWR
jgi:hypothetical protein